MVDPALHASAPLGLHCADCTIDNEPCLICYATWWRRKHPNVIIEGDNMSIGAELKAQGPQSVTGNEVGQEYLQRLETRIAHLEFANNVLQTHFTILRNNNNALKNEIEWLKAHQHRDYEEVPVNPAQIRGFESLQELVEAIERVFDCRDGMYSFHTVHEGVDIPYHVIGAITSFNNDGIICPQRYLRAYLYNLLCHTIQKQLPLTHKPILYWRFTSAERIKEESYGENRWKIRTRVAIPGVDWSKIKTADIEYPVI